MKILNITKKEVKEGMTVITAGGIFLREIIKVNIKTFECNPYMGYLVKEKISDLYKDSTIEGADFILDK